MFNIKWGNNSFFSSNINSRRLDSLDQTFRRISPQYLSLSACHTDALSDYACHSQAEKYNRNANVRMAASIGIWKPLSNYINKLLEVLSLTTLLCLCRRMARRNILTNIMVISFKIKAKRTHGSCGFNLNYDGSYSLYPRNKYCFLI